MITTSPGGDHDHESSHPQNSERQPQTYHRTGLLSSSSGRPGSGIISLLKNKAPTETHCRAAGAGNRAGSSTFLFFLAPSPLQVQVPNRYPDAIFSRHQDRPPFRETAPGQAARPADGWSFLREAERRAQQHREKKRRWLVQTNCEPNLSRKSRPVLVPIFWCLTEGIRALKTSRPGHSARPSRPSGPDFPPHCAWWPHKGPAHLDHLPPVVRLTSFSCPGDRRGRSEPPTVQLMAPLSRPAEPCRHRFFFCPSNPSRPARTPTRRVFSLLFLIGTNSKTRRQTSPNSCVPAPRVVERASRVPSSRWCEIRRGESLGTGPVSRLSGQPETNHSSEATGEAFCSPLSLDGHRTD